MQTAPDFESVLTQVRSKPLFRLVLRVGRPESLGRRAVVLIDGGLFEGDRLNGTVDPGGTDWITSGPDGLLRFDVRLVLRTDDGETIGMTYSGYRHGAPEVITRLNGGEPTDPSEYYFRTAPFFETASRKYDWLNRVVAIGIGERRPEGPVYCVHEVL